MGAAHVGKHMFAVQPSLTWGMIARGDEQPVVDFQRIIENACLETAKVLSEHAAARLRHGRRDRNQ